MNDVTTPRPRALVVYESMFGNTEHIAVEVARGLQLAGLDTGLVEVGAAPDELSPELDLLVVGGPTHAFALSRPSTRADAVRQGAPVERARMGLREWLGTVRHDPADPHALAAFDTRVTKVRWLPKAAGPSALRLAHKHGLDSVVKPIGFLVNDLKGPLVAGEADRAVLWGRQLGEECLERAATPVSGPR